MSGFGRLFSLPWPFNGAGASVATGVGAAASPINSVARDIGSFAAFMRPLEDIAVNEFGYARGVISAQVALETGYGKYVIGKNLFNIKAGTSWQGKKARVKTYEYVNGQKIDTFAYFRDYNSYEESVRDYIRLISGASRYVNTWAARKNPKTYFTELKDAGYATDPIYPDSLMTRYNNIKNLV